MAVGTIRVRNACPFSVTFYALAGPTIELPANTTRAASACLIWFSTRAKGGGDVINQSWLSQFISDWENELTSQGHSASEWNDDDDGGDDDDGSKGAAAGSILGIGLGELSNIFLVKNTNDNGTVYFGDKKEGVYGNSDLVIYATLDPACKLTPQNPPRKVWFLHLEKDEGQETPPDDTEPLYARPDLSKYKDGMFFRLRNIKDNSLLYSEDDQSTLGTRVIDVPFNPLEYPEYWSVNPSGNSDLRDVKVLNTLTNKWLTCYSADGDRIGLYSVGYEDFLDQHWSIVELGQNPLAVKLANSAVNGRLVGGEANGSVFLYPDLPQAVDQQWYPESFCINVDDIPDSAQFRIMHAKDGLYITGADCTLGTYIAFGSYVGPITQQHFVLRKANSGYYICTPDNNTYLRFNQSEGKLLFDSYSDTLEIIWNFRTVSTKSGFIITNGAPAAYGSQLYWNNAFGLYHGDYDDQLWVAQLL